MSEGFIEQTSRLFMGSYKGVLLYVESVSTTGGRKATARPILNSDEQNVADTGKRVRGYDVNAYVTARRDNPPPDDGKISFDYPSHRKAIIAALEDKAPGIFVHPWEGEVRDLVCETFSLDERMDELGRGALSITFIKKTVGVTPAEQTGTAEGVDNQGEEVDTSLKAMLESAWGVDLSFIDVAEQGIAKMEAAYAAVQDGVRTVENVAAEINGLAQDIATLTSEIGEIITSPLKIAQSIENAFIAIENIFPTLEAKFDAMTSQFGFGDDDADIDRSTAGGEQAARNAASLNIAMGGSFLVRAYSAATGLELQTTDQIAELEATLDAQHEKLVSNPDAPPEVRAALEDLRTAFSAFLQDARLSALDVVDEEISTVTPRILAFQFYGDDVKRDDLRELNGLESYETITGTAKVLSL